MTARNIHSEIAERVPGMAYGGIGAVHLLARRIGLIEAIDARLCGVWPTIATFAEQCGWGVGGRDAQRSHSSSVGTAANPARNRRERRNAGSIRNNRNTPG